LSKNSGKISDSVFESEFIVVRRLLKYALYCAGICLVVFYLSTSVAQVKVHETGVLLRFGNIVRARVEPGICLKFPWPIDRLQSVETQSVKRIRAGFGADPKAVAEFERTQAPLDQIRYGSFWIAYVLSGDKNIIHIKVVVSYKIADPVVFLFEVNEPDIMLRNLIQSSIINTVAELNVDDVLTKGKLVIQQKLQKLLVEYSQNMNLGLDILSVEVKNVRPPNQTSAAFKSVINAQEERTEMVHQADSYRNRLIPEANAEEEKIKQEAIAYKKRRIDQATGEAQRFEFLAAEYRLNPGVTRERLRLETLEMVLQNLDKYITETTPDEDLVNLRILSSRSQ